MNKHTPVYERALLRLAEAGKKAKEKRDLDMVHSIAQRMLENDVRFVDNGDCYITVTLRNNNTIH